MELENLLGRLDERIKREDENEFCESEGRRQAKIAISKNYYMQLYRLEPPEFLIKLEEKVCDAKKELKRNICLVTFNFEPDFKLTRDFEQDVRETLESRTWIEHVYIVARENMTKDGENTHPHIHAVIKLRINYAPSQIAQTL